MAQYDGQIITTRHLWWLALITVCIVAGAASLYVNPLFIVASLIMVVNVFLVLKYPIWGLLAYLIVFMLRPGEVFSVLAPLRMELLTGLLTMLAVVLQQKFREGKVVLPTDRISLLLFAFLLVMCITIFVSYEKTNTVQTVLDFLKLLIFYYLIVSIIDTKEKLVAFIIVYLLLIAYIAFDAFKLFLAGGFVHRMGVDRMRGATSFGGDPNSLANTLAATIPFIIASAYYFRNILAKIGLWIMALGMVVLITITASRGGLVAFGGVVAGGIIFSRHKLVAIVAVIILILAGWTVLPDQYKDRYRTLTDLEDLDQTSSGRWEIWVSGIKMIVSKPILGVGAGAFRWANDSGEFGPPQFMQAHNLYIQLIATTGVIGLIIWSAFIYAFIKNLWNLLRKVGRSEEYRWVRIFSISFAVSLIALFISGLFAHSLYRYTWYLMAALTAVLTAMTKIDDDNKDNINPAIQTYQNEMD